MKLDEISVNMVGLLFPAEWLKAALVVALFSTMVVIGVFAYLNRFTKKSYFNLWMVGWMFYAVWLGASIGLEESPHFPLLLLARRACIGISALFMFWGSFDLTGQPRSQRELGESILLLILWSIVAVYEVQDLLWITMPMFGLLTLASWYIGMRYWRMRKRYRGAGLLAVGFAMWGVHLLWFPFVGVVSPIVLTFGYICSSVLSLLIAFGMIVMVLEQARERNEALREEFRKGIARRRMLRQEVAQSEQKYQALFEAAGDAIFVVDLENLEIIETNEAAKKFCEIEPDRPRPTFATICPSLRGKSTSLLENKRNLEALFEGKTEFEVLRPSGVRAVCEGSANLIHYNRRPALQISIREITERKLLEQQLRQSEKLSALGRLIAGVAHELNNPLAVIMGYAQLLGKRSDSSDSARNEAAKILHESERAAKIVRNLLTFARPREPQMSAVNINKLIRELLDTRQGDLDDGRISLSLRLDPALPPTMADPHQIEQVITNLVVNAIQSMTQHTGVRNLEVATARVDNVARIIVVDSGPGIAPEVLGKIFDPFFTTKAPGKGTGLGLSICHSILEEHRGRIWVHSELGKGTQFFVELPLIPCEESSETAAPVAPPPQDPKASERRVLVVDDEPGIVEVLRAILSGVGYTVETAGNGQEAVEKLSKHEYDLVLSDLSMPGMDGEALYKHVQENHPELARRIVFVTGDTVSGNARAFLDRTGNRWLAKPFNIAEVETLVRNFLDNTPPAG